MLYNPPTGSTDPNAPYSGKNTAAGQQGSKVPRLAVEAPQREIVAAILDAGQVPTNDLLDQLARAIRGQVASYVTDVGTASAVMVAPPRAHGAYIPGMFFRVRMNQTATGAATFQVNNLLALPLVRADGLPTQKGDWLGGQIVEVVIGATAQNALLIGRSTSALPPKQQRILTVADGPSGVYVVLDGITDLYIELVGGGGGGAGGGAGVGWSSGGGGSGGYASGWIKVTPGQQIPYVVGVGGVGAGNANGAVGGQGGTTSFGAFMQATGGQGGQGGTTSPAGGPAGVGSGGQQNRYGGNGGDGNFTQANVQGGAGGASAFGGGGRTSTVYLSGVCDGKAPGSGGGGIWSTSAATAQQGGNGAPGQINISF